MIVYSLPKTFVLDCGDDGTALVKKTPGTLFREREFGNNQKGVSLTLGGGAGWLKLPRVCPEGFCFLFFDGHLLLVVLPDGHTVESLQAKWFNRLAQCGANRRISIQVVDHAAHRLLIRAQRNLGVISCLRNFIWLLPFQPFPDIDQGFAPFGPLDKADGGG